MLLGLALALAFRSDTLTLERALAEALIRRPRVAVSAAIVAHARGTSQVLGVIPNPVFQLDRYDAAPERKIYLTQSLNWLFRRAGDQGTGRALVDRARADSTAAIAELGREVRLAFGSLLARRQELALSTEQRTLADSLLVLAERRLSVGDIAALDRDQVGQLAALARLAESRAAEAEQVAAIELKRVIGRTDDGPLVSAGSLDDGLGAIVATRPVDVPPNLAAAVADSAAAAGRLRSAQRSQIPALGLRAGQEAGGDGFVAKSFLGFSIAIPIFSRGREAVAEAAGASRVAAGLAAEARLDLDARQRAAAVRLEQAQRRALIARDSLAPIARRIRAGATRLYEEGRTGILPVFEALRGEREVLLGMIDALAGFQRARADLLALVGRFE